MLDYAGTITIGATIGMVLVGIASTAFKEFGSRLIFAAVAGVWVGLVLKVVSAPALMKAIATVPVLFALPMVTVAALSIAIPAFRAALLAIPVRVIISLNAMRVLGVLFLLLAGVGRLGGPFPFFAGLGDILTGLLALSIAGLAVRASVSHPRVLLWNAFGTLDLIVAVFLGVTSQPNSPLQLIHAGVGTAAIITLPWAMIPCFLVPLYLVGHGIVFAQARRQAASDATHSLGSIASRVVSSAT